MDDPGHAAGRTAGRAPGRSAGRSAGRSEGRAAGRAARQLGRAAARLVGPDGGIASRNPEELARIVSVLSWSAEALAQAGRKPAEGHVAAMRRAAPVVRALTVPGGGLARFQGGRGGAEPALPGPAGAPPPTHGPDPRVMGYLRLAAGEAVLILDAAPPPGGRHAATAHLSTLGFELWLGPHPVIVSAGSGLGFGVRDAVTARRASAHSTVEIAGRSPGRMHGRGAGAPRLTATGGVGLRLGRAPGAAALTESTLYADRLGLVIERRLDLAPDGGRLTGEDTVLATDAAARARVARLFPADGPPCPVTARFHLHPDIRAETALAGGAVALTLPGGARWLMRAEAEALSLRPGRYYDEARAQPRATMQIVATTALREYWARIEWTLERVGTAVRPRAIRAAAES